MNRRLAVSVTDCATKRMAEDALVPGLPHQVLGDFLRFTLVYNRAGAMNISVGQWSRPVFAVCTLLILLTLPRWYQQLSDRSRWATVGLALIAGGAVGNLWQRVFTEQGVVDFIDFGIAQHRFFVFNVADIAVTVGACLVALTMWHTSRILRPLNSGDKQRK